jgi:hypothetical protein
MDDSFVEAIERISNESVQVEGKDGRIYSSLEMKPITYNPRPDAIKVRSLTAISDYLKANRDGLDIPKLIVHVVSPVQVVLLSELNGENRKRDSFLIADFDGIVFPFGDWMSIEQFIIAMNALVIQTDIRDELLSFASKITVSNDSEIADTGINQNVTVRQGTRGNLTENKAAPARVTLQPFRTFREVYQPEGEFIFRMRANGEGAVSVSLHEADGGAWKPKAMGLISDWLKENAPEGIAVIA